MLYPQFGSVSTGTLRNEDLLDSFADELEFCCSNHGAEVSQYADLLKEAREIDPDDENASEVVENLVDALNEFAAPYSYFGSLPGDGADYGFWPDVDSLEMAVFDGEVTKVSDLSEADEPGEYMMVNDHGNVTLGYVKDNGEFVETWSCV